MARLLYILSLMHYFLGLGSNCGERGKNLLTALTLLQKKGCEISRISSVYETEPVDFACPEWFFNQVVGIETDLEPRDLLALTQVVEKKMGRKLQERIQPRVIDIDILLAGDLIVDEEDLKIPHPRMDKRSFVLVPLEEIAPDVVHPLRKIRISDLRKTSGDRSVVRKMPISC